MPNHLHSAISRRIKRANGHPETIFEMIKQGHSCAKILQQLQAVESATENAPIQLTKKFFMKQTFRNTEDLALFHLLMFQRRES
jgi:DNA-binding FrmR family transcriptional regulator